MKHKIYIVGFGPSEGSRHGTGGFDWFHERAQAVSWLTVSNVEGFDLVYIEALIPEELTEDPGVSKYIKANYNERLP